MFRAIIFPNRALVSVSCSGPGAELARPQVDAMLANDLPWYVENIATDFYAAYHRWFPDRPVNWRYLEAKERYQANPADLSALVRDPSLSDPAWLRRIAERLDTVVRAHRPYAPLYYSLGDEPGIADLAANWDFDFAPDSLREMRLWLRGRYGDLSALNRQWGTRFAAWDAVMPETTTQAMARTDENYSAWADFKEWMDVAFARAVRRGAEAVRAADPDAVPAVEGTQVPGWGGYDYERLAPSVALMEIYDFGGSIELIQGFNPSAILLNTTGGAGAATQHRLWRQWLRGGSGLVIWDEREAFVEADGKLGPVGSERRAQFRELRSGLGALLPNSVRRLDQVGILYSPESMRARWMLDHRAKGANWIARDAEAEYEDNAHRTALTGFLRLARRLAVQPRFVSATQVGEGALRGSDLKVLLMPHVLALSDKAAAEIETFVRRQGGMVVADVVPGEFDGHVRRRKASALRDLFAGDVADRVALLDPGPERVAAPALKALLKRAGIVPVVAVLDKDGQPAAGLDTYVFENGEALLVGVVREALPPVDAASEFLRLEGPSGMQVTELRTGRRLGTAANLPLEVPRAEPVILALTPDILAAPRVSAPSELRAGETAVVAVERDARVATSVLQFEVIDPAGAVVPHYSGNWIVAEPNAKRAIPFALNDAPGRWQVRVTDVLGGQAVVVAVTLAGP